MSAKISRSASLSHSKPRAEAPVFQIGLEPLEHIHFGLVLLVALERLYSPVDPAVENVDI